MLVRMKDTIIEDIMKREAPPNCEEKILKKHLHKLKTGRENNGRIKY